MASPSACVSSSRMPACPHGVRGLSPLFSSSARPATAGHCPRRRFGAFPGIGLRQGGVRGGQSRDGDAIRRTADIIQSKLVTKFDGAWIPAMFTTDAELDARPGFPATHDRLLHERTDALAVEHRERIRLHQVCRLVVIDELRSVVT